MRTHVLDHDADLGDIVAAAERDSARQASVAALLEVPTGSWDARRDSDRARPGFGLLVPTRLAVLDIEWVARMARYTHVGPALAGRALMRSRRLGAMMAIVQQPRLEERLVMLFWELADRHGRVRADGVHVELPLTHEVLGHLAAARRPSVSGALTRLADQGRVRRAANAWVLSGDPPSTRSAA